MFTLFFLSVQTYSDYSFSDFFYNNGIDLLLTIVTLWGVLLTLKSIRDHNKEKDKEIKREEKRIADLNERILKTIEASTKTSRNVMIFISKKNDFYKDFKSDHHNTYEINITGELVEYTKENAAKIFTLAALINLHQLENHINNYEKTLTNFLLNYQNVLTTNSIKIITNKIIIANNLTVFLNQFNPAEIVSQKNSLEKNINENTLEQKHDMLPAIYEYLEEASEFNIN